jgi:hypothetical protein
MGDDLFPLDLGVPESEFCEAIPILEWAAPVPTVFPSAKPTTFLEANMQLRGHESECPRGDLNPHSL